MSYTPPSYNNVDFDISNSYSPPSYNSANFELTPATVIGVSQVQTPNGLIDINIYETSDITNNYLQVQTASGLGAINLVDPVNADTAIQIQTANQGLMGIKKTI